MAVKTYSRARDSNTHLTANFKVSEFACKDGSDKILIDDRLGAALQLIREHFGKAVTISSGYRNEAYNKKCGGASNSQHIYGTAADIHVSGVNPREVALFAEQHLYDRELIGGLGLYDYASTDKEGFTHIDVRTTNRAQWVQTRSKAPTGYKVVKSITQNYLTARPTIQRGASGSAVKLAQQLLLEKGYDLGKHGSDGDFGSLTETAVKKFQAVSGLTANGIVDSRTWAALEV